MRSSRGKYDSCKASLTRNAWCFSVVKVPLKAPVVVLINSSEDVGRLPKEGSPRFFVGDASVAVAVTVPFLDRTKA